MREIYDILNNKISKSIYHVIEKYSFEIESVLITPSFNGKQFACFSSVDVSDIDSFKWNKALHDGNIFDMYCKFSPRYINYTRYGTPDNSSFITFVKPPKSECKECDFTLRQADMYNIVIILLRQAGDLSELSKEDSQKLIRNIKSITANTLHRKSQINIKIKDVNVWE